LNRIRITNTMMFQLLILFIGIIVLLYVCSQNGIIKSNKLRETFDNLGSKAIEGVKLMQVSVHGTRACGVKDDNTIWCSKTGVPDWKQRDGYLKHISINGQKACGTNANDDIFCTTNIDADNPGWKHIAGKLKQIDITQNKMCGVNSADEIYCADFGSSEWEKQPGLLKHMSISGVKTCGVNANDDIFCSDSFMDPTGEKGWKHIPGKLKQIDLSGNTMCGVNSGGDTWCAPYASGAWTLKGKEQKYVSIDGQKAYTLDNDGTVQYAQNLERMSWSDPKLKEVVEPDGNNLKLLLADPHQPEFKDHEQQKCKWVSNVLKGEEEKYDVIKNYTLVNNPREENECYIKEIGSVIEGKCTKDNEDLYNPDKDMNIIEDIKSAEVVDGYVSNTLPKDACIIKFTNNVTSPEEVKSYLDRLDNNLPKLKKLRDDLFEAKEFSNVIKDEIGEKNREIDNANDEINRLDESIRKQEERLNSAELNPEPLKQKADALMKQINAVEQEYKKRQKLVTQVCEHKEFTSCVGFRPGVYNMAELHHLNDRITGMKVPEGLTARFYLHHLDRVGNPVDPSNNKFVVVKGGESIPDLRNHNWSDGTRNPDPNDNISGMVIQVNPVDQNVPMKWDYEDPYGPGRPVEIEHDSCCDRYKRCKNCPAGWHHVGWREKSRGYNCGLFRQPIVTRVCRQN
jgi:predicted RNA-binding protein